VIYPGKNRVEAAFFEVHEYTSDNGQKGHGKARKNSYFFTIRYCSEGLDFTEEFEVSGNAQFPSREALSELLIFNLFPTASAVG
jgi:hypothetical protein